MSMTSAQSQERVLVTGGAGFIGSHVVESLLHVGHHVLVVDDFSSGRRENLEELERSAQGRLRIYAGDITRGEPTFAAATSGFGPVQRVIHLAAQTSVLRSLQEPELDARINYCGTLETLRFARAQGVRSFVFASSAAVYGETDEQAIDERAPCMPLSPYGLHKLASEHLLRIEAQQSGMQTFALRFFNVYGPRQDPKSAYSGVITLFMAAAARGESLRIFGDGEQTRDFVYVGDVAEAVRRACFASAEMRYEVFNVGTGMPSRVQALAERIAGLAGGQVRIEHAPARSGEIRHSLAKVAKAKASLGFASQVSFEQGLERTWRWFRGA